MIGKLKGSVDLVGNGYILVDVGGVGYKVAISHLLLSEKKAGDDIVLYTHTHVREDQLSLFGFETNEKLSFFELLIGVSGVGPKAALNIMSAAPTEALKESISKQDPSLLNSVSGIGKKTAEKIVIDLRNKMGAVSEGNIFENSTETDEILSALEGLGYKTAEVRSVLGKLKGENTEDRIKEALKLLSK